MIEVVYATPDVQRIINVPFQAGMKVIDAIEISGILNLFPQINLDKQKVGIFSQIVSLDILIKDGDRIEIYRDLLSNPKEKRKLRVKNMKNKNTKK